jgi:hypothetical protein
MKLDEALLVGDGLLSDLRRQTDAAQTYDRRAAPRLRAQSEAVQALLEKAREPEVALVDPEPGERLRLVAVAVRSILRAAKERGEGPEFLEALEQTALMAEEGQTR